MPYMSSRTRLSSARTVTDLLARQRGAERELQLLVVLLRAYAEVALGVRHQGLVQPGLLLVHGLLQAVDGDLQALVGLRQFTDVRGDEGIDDAEDALVLATVSAWIFGTRAGSRFSRAGRRSPAAFPCARWPTSGAPAVARTRAPSGRRSRCRRCRCTAAGPTCRTEALRRSRFPTAAGCAGSPRPPGSRGPAWRHVDLVQLAQQRLGGHGLLLAGGTEVVQFAVVAVVTDLGGADRRQLHPGIQRAWRSAKAASTASPACWLATGVEALVGASAGWQPASAATGRGQEDAGASAFLYGQTLSIGWRFVPWLPWAQTRTLQRSAEHGIPGSCHCGRIAFTVQAEAPIRDVIDCNCSMCRRRGSLLWFAPRAAFQLTTDPADVATYHFNKAHIDHHHCRECGVAPSEAVDPRSGTPMVAVNALRAAGRSGWPFGDLLRRSRTVTGVRLDAQPGDAGGAAGLAGCAKQAMAADAAPGAEAAVASPEGAFLAYEHDVQVQLEAAKIAPRIQQIAQACQSAVRRLRGIAGRPAQWRATQR